MAFMNVSSCAVDLTKGLEKSTFFLSNFLGFAVVG
jgi:hypothetical protein